VSWDALHSPVLLAALVARVYCTAREGNLDHHGGDLGYSYTSVWIYVWTIDDAIHGQQTGLVGDL